MLTEIRIKATPVLKRNQIAWETPGKKILVDQGGTRSSKTYSIAQLFILKMLKTEGKKLTITRKTSPSMRSSVMRDFFEILAGMNLYDERLHNKTYNEYVLHNNLVEFISMDQPQKKRGAKRNWLWLNEANEFSYEDFFQLFIRTTDKTILDYNPADEFHWIYDKILTRKDCVFIRSTYRDNPFLERSIVEEIERLKVIDENYWRIYGLGERGCSRAVIFDNWDLVDEFPDTVDEILYGVDFGYNNPSVLLKVGIKDRVDVYVEELLYQRYLTNTDFISRLGELIPDRNKLIKADSAEPDRIEEISRAGFYVQGARKGKGSVKDGIDTVKRKRIHIVKNSSELIKEVKSYKWKEDTDGRILDEPVAFNDHAVSALRYAIGDMDENELKVWDL